MRFPRETCAVLSTCRLFSWMVKSIKKVKIKGEIGSVITVLKATWWHLACLRFRKNILCRFSFCVWSENKHLYVKGYHLFIWKAVLRTVNGDLKNSYHLSQMFTLKSESMWERLKSQNCYVCSPNKKIPTWFYGDFTYF